jgi:hypothetical protein
MANLIESVSSKAGAIAELAKRLGNSELMLEISDLKMQLADVKIAYAALQDENIELKSQHQEDIDNPLSISPTGIYFDAQRKLFCAGCYDGPAKRRVHLIYRGANVGSVLYTCPVCNTEYQDRDNIGPVEPFIRHRQSSY